MKKNIYIPCNNYNIHLVSNGAENYNNIALCFHGFNGDKWGDAYAGLKHIEMNSLVCSFDSCGHGDSPISSLDMRLDIILEEIDEVVSFLKKNEPSKPIILIGLSYGAYRIMQYLIKYHPSIEKVIFINPVLNILETLEMTKEFKYLKLKENELVPMKRSLNKYMTKAFLDDLYQNNLYKSNYTFSYNVGYIFRNKR